LSIDLRGRASPPGMASSRELSGELKLIWRNAYHSVSRVDIPDDVISPANVVMTADVISLHSHQRDGNNY